LPEHLVEEARQMLGFKSNPDTIIFALSELVRRGRIEQLKSMMGRFGSTATWQNPGAASLIVRILPSASIAVR
jgi:hypothetical protein